MNTAERIVKDKNGNVTHMEYRGVWYQTDPGTFNPETNEGELNRAVSDQSINVLVRKYGSKIHNIEKGGSSAPNPDPIPGE